MDENNAQRVPRAELLYDKETLAELVDEHGPPYEIKFAVDTSATLYEIRTAHRYWLGGSADHRTSERIWRNCKAVDDGLWAVDNGEVIYA